MAEEQVDSSSVPETEKSGSGRKREALGRTLGSVLVVGRELLAKRRTAQPEPPRSAETLAALCNELLDHRGEASGLALAAEVVNGYRELPEGQRLVFFELLARDFEVEPAAVLEAAERYRENSSLENLWAIKRAGEAPRQKLFRRINMAPDGTSTLVAMRGHLLEVLPLNQALRGVNTDLRELFISWFNKGFLELRRIDWSSPAEVLEKLFAYEAVHEINGWDDLRSRLRDDRRCFAFFHPALENDPLVFVEIALTDSIPESLEPLLVQDRALSANTDLNTVVFYSISNCHPGLTGVSFGNFLIKNVMEELQREIPTLKTFVTLSSVPGFVHWLRQYDIGKLIPESMVDRVREPVGTVIDAQVYEALRKLCAYYLLNIKSDRFPADSGARFHLRNGAQLFALHSGADLSHKGREQSAGIMVNYLYDPPSIEENHEAYFDTGKIAVSRAVSKLVD